MCWTHDTGYEISHQMSQRSHCACDILHNIKSPFESSFMIACVRFIFLLRSNHGSNLECLALKCTLRTKKKKKYNATINMRNDYSNEVISIFELDFSVFSLYHLDFNRNHKTFFSLILKHTLANTQH